MKLSIDILSSFKQCKQLPSIVIYHCVFPDEFFDSRKTAAVENDVYKWLNDNSHLIYEENFHLQCDMKNRMIKLWFKQI